jgi:hypothetical protein
MAKCVRCGQQTETICGSCMTAERHREVPVNYFKKEATKLLKDHPDWDNTSISEELLYVINTDLENYLDLDELREELDLQKESNDDEDDDDEDDEDEDDDED